MSLTRIEQWDVRRDGPLSEASLQRKLEAQAFDVCARIYPATIASTGAIDARDSVTAVVRGLVRLTVDGEPEMLTAGDMAFVPGGVERRLEVVGPSPALCLEAFRGR
jgi:mannose-6-phosphate isomerase-like protein (cupin superfamily)